MEMILEIFFSKIFIFADEFERIQNLGRNFFLRRNELVEFDGDIDKVMSWNPPESESEQEDDSDEEYKQGVSDVDKMQSSDEDKEGESDVDTKEGTKIKDKKTKAERKKTKDESSSSKDGSAEQGGSSVSTEPKPPVRTYRYRQVPGKPKRYGTLGNITFELSDSD